MGLPSGYFENERVYEQGLYFPSFFSHFLNIHLRDNVVSRFLRNDLVKKVKDLEKTVEAEKKVVQRALTKSDQGMWQGFLDELRIIQMGGLGRTMQHRK